MTGLIYVAIIALWAAVLIPIWLRRHEADETRAVDRFDGAMRALGRFRRTGRDGSLERTISPAATRRRRVLLALTALLLVALVTWFVGWIPGWAPIIVVVLLVGFLFLARRQTMLAARNAARPSRSVRDNPPPRGRRREERVYEDIDVEYTKAREADLARPRRRDPLRPTGSWEAMPQNLPTYVDAPSASAVPRRIDRATGTWDSQAMLDQVRTQREMSAQDFFDQTCDYEEPRRAAGA